MSYHTVEIRAVPFRNLAKIDNVGFIKSGLIKVYAINKDKNYKYSKWENNACKDIKQI